MKRYDLEFDPKKCTRLGDVWRINGKNFEVVTASIGVNKKGKFEMILEEKVKKEKK